MTEISFTGPNGFEAEITEIHLYSDGTPRVSTPDYRDIVTQADTVILRPSNLTSLIAGLSIVDGVNDNPTARGIRTLVIPYLPGARQDRANPTGDVGFTLSTIGRLLYSYKEVNRVVTVDPHSLAAFDHVQNLDPLPLPKLYSRLYRGYSGVIAPDKGARSRAVSAFDTLFGIGADRELVQASKVRDPSTGRLSGFEVTVTPGAHYLVVDDICDGGGTFVGLGEQIAAQGAYADLFVTHGIFSKGTAQLTPLYKNIFTTNTRRVRGSLPGVHVFDILPDLMEYAR